MVSRIPQSSSGAFKIIREIIALGKVDIPPQFNGAGAPGETLESLCKLERNNFDSPDLKDWEVKFHGGNALLTLLHKDPQPKGVLDKMVNTFGWNDSKGRISFRHTIKGRSERGFIIDSAANKITVSNINDPSIVAHWEHNVILNAIGAKLRRLILVHGTVDRVNRQVIYESANAYWDLNLLGFAEATKEGLIYIDFDARTKAGRGTALRNHGTKFRIHINDISQIYENHQLII
jgi:hypothetical protein